MSKNPIFQEHPKKIEEAVRTNLEEGVDLIQGRLETSPRDWVFQIFLCTFNNLTITTQNLQ